MRPARRSLAERFWSKVDRRSDDECWPWKASGVDGYGVIGSGGRNGIMLRASRVSWEFANGPIPNGLCVCHRCDNPPCVNPAHLFLGTLGDNNADTRSKGKHGYRRHVGTVNGRAILNEAQVLEIRDSIEPARVFAAKYGVCEGTIWAIRQGRNWKHLAEYGRRTA